MHVPFREANSALNAVVSGAVQMMFSIATIGAAADRRRDRARPRRDDAEGVAARPRPAGHCRSLASPGFDVVGWNGFVAPPGTPAPIVAKLNAALQRALDDKDVRTKLEAAGYEPVAHNTPDAFAAFIRADTEKWIDLVEKTKMREK